MTENCDCKIARQTKDAATIQKQTKIWRALHLHLNTRVFFLGNLENEWKRQIDTFYENTCRKKLKAPITENRDQNLRTQLIKSEKVRLLQDFKFKSCLHAHMSKLIQIKQILICIYSYDLIWDTYHTPVFSPPHKTIMYGSWHGSIIYTWKIYDCNQDITNGEMSYPLECKWLFSNERTSSSV